MGRACSPKNRTAIGMSIKTNSQVRVRFAPSPTGHLHIGGLRAALFNWLFARHHQGIFCVRIEDTDVARSLPEYTESILDSLRWCALQPDEPLLIQSSRFPEHKQALDQLLVQGKAYRCYCTAEEIAARQGNISDTISAFAGYDRFCRTRTDKPSGDFGIRFAIPIDRKSIIFDDLIRGRVEFSTDQLDDFIIARSDGYPLYNFVVVQDDAYMQITHIIRGEEHLSNTPRQILLYEAFNYEIPIFAHVPLILGPDGNKLSKRDAATAVLDYKRAGYLPDALINYLVRLGWSHGDQEIFTKQELIAYFDLDHVGKKGAIFDKEKLDWVNSIYIRALAPEALYDYIIAHLEPKLADLLAPWDKEKIIASIALYQDRIKTIGELLSILYRLRIVPHVYDEHDVATWITPQALEHLELLMTRLETLDQYDADQINMVLKQMCKEFNIKLVALAQPVRLALVGTTASPSIFALMALLGKQESLQRLSLLVDLVTRSKAN